MAAVAKIDNPVCIRVGDNENVVLADAINTHDDPLIPGVMFGGNRYGFILITDRNGRQSEQIYPTQNRITAVGIEGKELKVFEEGKRFPWRFSKSGKLTKSIYGDFSDEYVSRVNSDLKKSDTFDKAIMQNPIRVRLSKNPKDCILLNDEKSIDPPYPLYPGVFLGVEHYGFVLIIDDDTKVKEMSYPTQNRIISLGMDVMHGDLKIFEDGKYNPWVFSEDGEFKQQASYNPDLIMDNKCGDVVDDASLIRKLI